MDLGVGIKELVMVSNRLPVDRAVDEDGNVEWKTSPGGLVTAVEPIVQQLGCIWVGWPGDAGSEAMEPFDVDRMRLVPVSLSTEEVEEYYEGFSNGTLWPLYHDVIAQPEYHREWWDQYVKVNRRFAQTVAGQAAKGAVVWVHDYQLQLVPGMLRDLRPDLTIGFFLHIPFPARRLFAQLPWRRPIIQGLLGADVIGFQTVHDAESFRECAETYAGAPTHGNLVMVSDALDNTRQVIAQEFPISIDTGQFAQMAADPDIQRRALEIRKEVGSPKKLLLGVDRLDYTKGIRHRLKAYGELLAEGEIDPEQIVLVQVATPSRERVDAYQLLRDQVEVTVGRINGDYGSLGHTPVVYLHQGFSREEMVALYLAADVAVVTALRDGMNLVAKEYVACRLDETGVLMLSEFAGARDELDEAILVNPHDIEGMKAAFLRSIHMPPREQKRRMAALRETVSQNDVAHWAANYLGSLAAISEQRSTVVDADESEIEQATGPTFIPRSLEAAIRRLATAPNLLVVSDFDGTLAPFVDDPARARMLPRAKSALQVLSQAPGVQVAILSGRAVASLRKVGAEGENWILSGSHGAELVGIEGEQPSLPHLDASEARRLGRLERRLNRVFGNEPGVRLESKPFGVAVHTRQVKNADRSEEVLAAASELAGELGIELRKGKEVREFSVRRSDKGASLEQIRRHFPDSPVLFLGDDVTDEDAFAILRSDDVGVKVGEGESVATERVPDAVTAAAVLALLAELRTGTVIGDYTL